MTGSEEGMTAAGARCRTLAHRPRFPNVMPDVDEFLGRWNAPAAPRRPARLLRSADGNINTVGLPGIHEADDVDPGHPQWRAAIEDGVWPLVDTLTTGAWRLVTYDSCEGHAHRSASLTPGRRRVGVLPRSPQEFARAAAALCRAVRAAAPDVPAPVRITLGTCDLTCGRTGRRRPVLDLGLEPAPGTGDDAYFAALHTATEVLADALLAQRPAADRPCGCPAGGRRQ
ncbi:hypothetical protein [Streptomyces heilongjiangensis]|uniref:Uncharacterized protein n=1 Tax=Streptomyces heilongjiangensis TaxID=945052 RepID=A0ABW1B7M4_9ACTN|nr:hypothetical protein [Streptomyces heilongjiangensis]MDC2950118.1 hypothetical protein [Streptomyces heilongjiangensis]